MAFEIPCFKVSEVAAADLSAAQYKLVKETSTGVNVCGAGEAATCGVLQNKPTAGQTAELMVSGVTKVLAGAATAKGLNVTPDATARVVAAGTGDYIAGTLMEAAAAAGDIVTLLINPQGRSA